MSTAVSDALLEPTRRPVAVETLTDVIDAEVADKSGLGGAAVKAGYAAAKKLGGNFVTSATDRLLPQFASALDPFWATKGDSSFGAHLAAQPDAAADALLAVTDAKAANTSHGSAAKVYGSLRGKAKGHVVAALPAWERPWSASSPDASRARGTASAMTSTYAAGPAPTQEPARSCARGVAAGPVRTRRASGPSRRAAPPG